MKSLLYILLFVFTLSGCEKIQSENKTVSGTGPIKSEERILPAFTKIDSRIGANINIIKSSVQRLQVSAQGNLLPLIHMNVINDALIITSNEKSMKTDSAITIDVYISSLEEVNIPGAGQIRSECALQRVYLSGSGNIYCTGTSPDADIILSGSGNIDLMDMEVTDANIRISGSGNVRMNVSGSLDISISGMGNVYYKGHPSISQQISGVGNVIYLE